MSFHGGLFGIFLSIFFYSKRKKIIFFQLSDLVSIVAPIGIFFGRLANFINVELYGRVTDFKIAMIYPTIDNLPRHPSQIYEALFEGVILFIIMYFYCVKFYKEEKYGLSTSFFLIFYSLFRFSLEFFREPDSQLGLFLELFSMGQFLCIPMIVLGAFIYLKKNK